jgi:hypothetical protein
MALNVGLDVSADIMKRFKGIRQKAEEVSSKMRPPVEFSADVMLYSKRVHKGLGPELYLFHIFLLLTISVFMFIGNNDWFECDGPN